MKNVTSFPTLTMGVVEIHVKDLVVLKDFYTRVLGLEILSETTKSVTLGYKNISIVHLTQLESGKRASSQEAGLYHIAILFASRSDLSRTVKNIVTLSPQSFEGSADHLVSEAFYFHDPEGNGIELYFDRDRSVWEWESGKIKMASLYIDPITYIKTHLSEDAFAEKRVGHVHLKVGNIDEAYSFYVDTVGFDVTATLPQALFVSVDGYHHHIGMNTWESDGALKRGETLGLKQFEVLVTKKDFMQGLKKRLIAQNIPIIASENSITFSDPWNNTIVARI